MKVRVKLYARLERYLPKGGADPNEADLDVAPGTTVAEVFQGLGLPREYCHLVLVNGLYLAPGERETRVLETGDHLAAWPPVAGGVAGGAAGGAGKNTAADEADEKKPAAGDGKSAADPDPAAGSAAGGAGVADRKTTAPAAKKTLVSKEMAVTHAEFFRTLPRALGTSAFRKTGRGAVLEEGARRLEIGLGPERTRKIAGLSLPATDVTLAFVGYGRTEIAAAVKKFERAFQKGGG